MYYRHVIDDCFARETGDNRLDEGDFETALGEAAAALDTLRAARVDGNLPLLNLPRDCADFAAFAPVAQKFRANFDDVVVLGTGGSSLGGQALLALGEWGFARAWSHPRVHFMDNIDPHSFDRLLATIAPARTGFIVISKSGGTAETMSQFLACFDFVERAVASPARHFVLVSQPGDSALRRFAAQHDLEVLDHDPDIGGRFSVLTVVGMLPAMIAGLKAEGVRAGASDVLDESLSATDARRSAPAVGAAISVALWRTRGITATVLMPYVDRLAVFGLWYRQLWAESLGKDGLGTTPIRALGTTDQHSQLQLYLAGPRDKMFTLVTLDCADAGPRVTGELAADPALAYLRDKTLGDLMEAEQRATADTLAGNGRPVRRIALRSLDERVLGALFMHFMLETMIAARLLGVNAFDQPAVEEGKARARAYLSGGDAS